MTENVFKFLALPSYVFYNFVFFSCILFNCFQFPLLVFRISMLHQTDKERQLKKKEFILESLFYTYIILQESILIIKVFKCEILCRNRRKKNIIESNLSKILKNVK